MGPRLENMVGAALLALVAGLVASAIGYFACLTLFTHPGMMEYEFSDSKPEFRIVQILIDRGPRWCSLFWNRRGLFGFLAPQ
jgi:hypothetical protein